MYIKTNKYKKALECNIPFEYAYCELLKELIEKVEESNQEQIKRISWKRGFK